MIEILQHLFWLVILYFHHLPVEYCDIILWHSASVNMHAIWTNICSWFQICILWTLWCFILCNSWNSVTNSLILLSVNTLQMLRDTGCPRRNVKYFGRVFLMLNYTDVTQNTYIQSWTVTEIKAREKCGLLGCRRTVRRPWRHTHPMRMPGNESS